MIFVPLLVFLALVVFLAGFRVAQQYQRGVVLRFGRYVATRGPGLFWIIPLIETVMKVDMRVVTSTVSGQEAISRDNVPIRIDAVIWRRIVVAERSVFEVRNVEDAVVQVAITTLRDIIGRHTLDEILKEQMAISTLRGFSNTERSATTMRRQITASMRIGGRELSRLIASWPETVEVTTRMSTFMTVSIGG